MALAATQPLGASAASPTIERDRRGRARLAAFYTPLDEALETLRRRRRDRRLAAAVAAWQRAHPPRFLPGEPALFFVRSLFSPDYELTSFAALVAAARLPAVCLELAHDRFVSFNADKYCRGKMTFRWGAHRCALRVVDFARHDGRRFAEIETRGGRPLREFHHALLAHAAPALAGCVREVSVWNRAAGAVGPRYLHLLALAVRDGILVENFCVNDAEERRLALERVLPSFACAEALFGVRPLVVPVVEPEHEDEPIWRHYPGALFPVAQALLRPPSGPR